MGSKDLRSWLEKLEAEGELRRVSAEVDWAGEIAEILRRLAAQRGPAVLFENIKGHKDTWCRKLFANGLVSRKRIALMFGMPKDTTYPELTSLLRKRFKEPVAPEKVSTGPVKENIIKGADVDLFQIPVPKWHPLDGGRYINTWSGVITMDPETGEHNVGNYRGMIISENKIGVLLVAAQGWGGHFAKYRRMGKPMPVAVAYGGDPSLGFMASCPICNAPSEYEIMGSIMQEPVPLVKCETSDLMVPATAEIVVEGSISPDPNSYEMEGPFGEWTGYYGQALKRPVIKVDCITFRNDPIFRGSLEGVKPGMVNETALTGHVSQAAVVWHVLESQGFPGILDVVGAPWAIVKIHKSYQGQARHIAAAIWGSKLPVNTAKTVMVVEEDVDISRLGSLQIATQSYVDPAKDIIVYPMQMGSSLDVSLSSEGRDEVRWGAGFQNHVLIDATIDWETHPIREEWGNRRMPIPCTEPDPEIAKLVEERWEEYGF